MGWGVGGREDSHQGWLKSIGCRVGWGGGGGNMAEDYRVSVWGGVGMIVTEVGLRLSGVSEGWG